MPPRALCPKPRGGVLLHFRKIHFILSSKLMSGSEHESPKQINKMFLSVLIRLIGLRFLKICFKNSKTGASKTKHLQMAALHAAH